MERVTISKRILDRLIRAKLVQLDECVGVNALPVVVRPPNGNNNHNHNHNQNHHNGCNWMIPGWTGDVEGIDRCQQKMKTYLEFLRGQFNVTD